MKLPNADKAYVEREKITDYLLCFSHPDGGSKARFFVQFGFLLDKWEILANALRTVGTGYPVSHFIESDYGIRYCVDGPLETPSGFKPMIRTVWMIEKGDPRPRLITAYPI